MWGTQTKGWRAGALHLLTACLRGCDQHRWSAADSLVPDGSVFYFEKEKSQSLALPQKRLSFPEIRMSVCYLQVKVKGNWRSYLNPKVWPRLVWKHCTDGLSVPHFYLSVQFLFLVPPASQECVLFSSLDFSLEPGALSVAESDSCFQKKT
ncbi:unnamed protein product [Rangifer tarandus platyrhynchus]|uniref:Uncharacterized protein n=1 Tax=Rangifer tarandus platyrhynchus TaxID=3082113 RepID=A0AC59YWE9_RANTA